MRSAALQSDRTQMPVFLLAISKKEWSWYTDRTELMLRLRRVSGAMSLARGALQAFSLILPGRRVNAGSRSWARGRAQAAYLSGASCSVSKSFSCSSDKEQPVINSPSARLVSPLSTFGVDFILCDTISVVTNFPPRARFIHPLARRHSSIILRPFYSPCPSQSSMVSGSGYFADRIHHFPSLLGGACRQLRRLATLVVFTNFHGVRHMA